MNLGSKIGHEGQYGFGQEDVNVIVTNEVASLGYIESTQEDDSCDRKEIMFAPQTPTPKPLLLNLQKFL